MSITIIGIGMGNRDNLTIKAWEAIKNSSVIIGSKRAVDSVCSGLKAKIFYEIATEKIENIIDEFDENTDISILMSGDSGFFSGTEGIKKIQKNKPVTILPGISSLSYMAAKIQRPWQCIKSISAHGKDLDILNELISSQELFFITGGRITAKNIIDTALNKGLDFLDFYVGERLSYENEKITHGKASDLAALDFDPLAVVWVVNNRFNDKNVFQGEINDSEFLRENVPMTKQDIRTLIIKRLKMKKNDVVYDIGGGTGSVGISIALSSPSLKVFSVENNQCAYELILKNKEKFAAYNLTVISGEAPTALKKIPCPNCAFIGGSHGNIVEILHELIFKNENIRIVLTAVTMETLCTAWEAFKTLNIKNVEIVEVSVTNATKVGNYNLLKSENPVFILSGGGKSDD